MGQKKVLQQEFKVSEFFLILKKNIIQLLIWSIIGLAISILFAFVLVTPKYNSTVDLLVNQKADNSQTQFNVQQADLQAINTYKDVLKKPVILEPALEHAKQSNNYQGSLKSLTKKVNITNQNDSQIISITVTDKNAYTARDIANDISFIFTKKIKKMMKIDNVMIVNKATVHTTPIAPNKKLYLLGGIILGFIVGILVSMVREIIDTSVKDTEFLESLGLVNLGKIYHIKDSKEGYQAIQVLDTKNNNNRSRRV